MRCAQCGAEAALGAAFCSRCGTRVAQPRPAAVREYALSRILPSWWHFARELLVAIAMLGCGAYLFLDGPRGSANPGALLAAGGVVVLGLTSLTRRSVSWSLTSDRLIERRGLLASRRREMELADVRSIEVDRSLRQKMLGLGTVAIASAASAEFLIRMTDIPDPEEVAEMLRQARLKRLA